MQAIQFDVRKYLKSIADVVPCDNQHAFNYFSTKNMIYTWLTLNWIKDAVDISYLYITCVYMCVYSWRMYMWCGSMHAMIWVVVRKTTFKSWFSLSHIVEEGCLLFLSISSCTRLTYPWASGTSLCLPPVSAEDC